MRRVIPVALLAVSASVLAADPTQYKFTFKVKVGDSAPVMLSAAVPQPPRIACKRPST